MIDVFSIIFFFMWLYVNFVDIIGDVFVGCYYVVFEIFLRDL